MNRLSWLKTIFFLGVFCAAAAMAAVIFATPEVGFKTIVSFDGANGANPLSPLVKATDGNFYGTTNGGGANDKGTVFQLSPAGTLTTLYRFCSQPNCTDGSSPEAGLIQVPGGNLWGSTEFGGSSNEGTVFALDVGLEPFVETLPTSGTVGTPVTLLGYEMTGATSVTFNGTPATFQVVSAHGIKTTVPSGATSGPVVVTTPSRTLTSNVNFQVH